MKIALIGYGKMGHMIEEIARQRGHEIVCCIDADNTADFDTPAFASADVAIEFSAPSCALDNILKAFGKGMRIVSGTTGWTAEMPCVKAICERGEGTLLWASNFSIGVNLFMKLNSWLARLMSGYPQYHPSLNEVHHVHKLDHPSGTAITLAEQLIAESPSLNRWSETEEGVADDISTLGISHQRMGEVPGIHTITWDSDVDYISITHSAKSRRGFALGAVVAAEWLQGRDPGLYSMADVLG